MIPRVARLGTGFVGAGQYYLNDARPIADTDKDRPTAGEYVLHDKKGAQTKNRVGFTETRNLPTNDPDKALRCMAANAQHVRQGAVAAAAKAAGMTYDDYVRETNPFRGRKGQKPVYTLSLAWHPTRNRAPAREDMVKAADEVLKTLGLDKHQALIVQHTDTAHPHIHLIVNRVSPIDGRYASLGNDWLKLSWWAMQHERQTGLVLCHERIFNWEQRHRQRASKAQNRKTNPQAKGQYVRHKQTPRSDHDWFQKHKHMSDEHLRAARLRQQERERREFAAKQVAAIARHDTRLDNSIGREHRRIEAEIERRRTDYEKTYSPKPTNDVRSIFRTVATTLSPRRFLEQRQIRRLATSATGLDELITTKRTEKRDKLGSLWEQLEVRHAAERRRDEERIAERQRRGRSEATSARSRKVFKARADTATAVHFDVQRATRDLTHDATAAAQLEKARSLSVQHALERMTRRLGGKPFADQDDRKALSQEPGPTQNADHENHPHQTMSKPDENETPSTREPQTDRARNGRPRRRRNRPRKRSPNRSR